MQLIEAKKTETAKRVTKLRAQLDAAEAELHNLEITADTLARLGINPVVETTVPRGQSYTHVLAVLADSEFGGRTPKEIYEALVASGVTSISQDNVRTILSRHKDRFETSDGRYWRKAAEATTEGFDDILGGGAVQTENEPRSGSAGGSDAAISGAPTPVMASSVLQSDWDS